MVVVFVDVVTVVVVVTAAFVVADVDVAAKNRLQKQFSLKQIKGNCEDH